MKIKQTPIDELIPYASNSRTHSDEQVAQIAASIKEFGFNNPVLLDKENGIIAGHGRVLAGRKLGLKEVPTIELSHLTDTQRKAYVIADNKLALNAGWDMELLSLEMGDLRDEGFDLSLIGFNDDELANMFVDKTEGLTDPDEVPDIPDDPVTVKGDVWLLGKHRLMCGDSTSIEAVDKLMDGVKIDLIHTDPPYGISEKGDRTGRNTGLAKNHNFPDFDDSSTDAAQEAFIMCDAMNIQRQVWWGANYYAHAVPQTANWFVWDKRVKEKMHDTQSDCELAWVKSKWSSVRIFRHLWKGFNKDSERNSPRVHPTQKPVALIEWVFDYYKDIKTVMDLFGGSGSTLMAAEKQNKQCYMMEFTPHYCDVIIKRWQDFTGEQAKLEGSGQIFPTIKADAA